MRFNEETELPEGWYWEKIGDRFDGTPQMGLNLTQEQLEKRPLSYSSAKLFQESPRHYASKFIAKTPYIPSAGVIIGKITDILVLEEDKFDKTFRVLDKAKGTGSREINKENLLQAQKDGVMIISKDDLQTAKYCKESIMDHNEARQLIEAKKNVQKKLEWRNKATNIPLLGYLDFEANVWDTDFIVDLKTGISADPDEFNRAIANFKYHIQGGFYRNYYKIKQFRFPEFLNLCVETKEPYNTTIMFYEGKLMQQAEDEFLGTLLAFRKAMNEKRFHEGYDFRLFDNNSYFAARLPGYYKPKYGGLK